LYFKLKESPADRVDLIKEIKNVKEIDSLLLKAAEEQPAKADFLNEFRASFISRYDSLSKAYQEGVSFNKKIEDEDEQLEILDALCVFLDEDDSERLRNLMEKWCANPL